MEVRDSYRTIEQAAEGPIYKEKSSKFYGLAFHVQSQEEIKSILEELWKKHGTASHICYAWRLGVNGELSKANDDGEPHNSAGAPILGQITAFELSYILVAVIRYYGGKKLGVSGLIQAYKTSARDTLELAAIVEKEIQDRYRIRFGYNRINQVNQIVKRNQWEVISREMKEDCSYFVAVRVSETSKFETEIERLRGIVIEEVFKFSDGKN